MGLKDNWTWMGKNGRIRRCHKKIIQAWKNPKPLEVYPGENIEEGRAQEEPRIGVYGEEEQDEGFELHKERRGSQWGERGLCPHPPGHSPTGSQQSWVLVMGSIDSPRHSQGMNQVQGPPRWSSRRQGYNMGPGSTQKTGPETGLETGPTTA